jgi:hypothetical protein
MNKYKNGILFFILLSTTLSFSCEAQCQSPDSVSLKSGLWALQFGIAGNFTLTSFQGSTIGAKYQLSENNAIRGGITINGNTSSGPSSSSGAIGDTGSGTVNGSSSSKSAGASFVMQYLWYMNPNGPVHFYTGFGPSVSYSYYQSSSDYFDLDNINSHGYWVEDLYGNNSTQWGAGIAVSAGVEWFACKWLSLHADYNESIQYQWRSSSSSTNYRTSTYPGFIPENEEISGTTRGWALISSGVSFGLSIYL